MKLATMPRATGLQRAHSRREHGLQRPGVLAQLAGSVALPSGEDVDLVERFEAAGLSHSLGTTELSVITSAATTAGPPTDSLITSRQLAMVAGIGGGWTGS